MERAVLEAVVRADIFLSSVPWKHIGLSLVIAAALLIGIICIRRR